MTAALTVSVLALVVTAFVVVPRQGRGGGERAERPKPAADVAPAEPGAEGMLVTAPGQIAPGPPDPAES